MSKKYPGGIIKGTPVVPTATSAPGIWTVCQATTYAKDGIWPRSPGSPTIGTATAGSNDCAAVTFSAPSCTGSASITGYTAISTPGCITGTGSSSPINVTGLTDGTSYTFKVKATNGAGTGPVSSASNSITATKPTCSTYTTAGTYTWVAPTGVTSVSVVTVGAGSQGGGALAYRNGMAVTPGNSYTVFVPTAPASGCRNARFTGASSSVYAQSACGSDHGYASSSCGTAKYNGGQGGYAGGGAGGYAGCGGAGQGSASGGAGVAGSGGAGGGGGVYYCCGSDVRSSGAGGGVGLYGQGSNGAAGGTGYLNNGGGGGSGGCSGNSIIQGGASASRGGNYGGGYGQGGTGSTPGKAAVRIVWAGGSRGTPSFPSTNVGP